MSRVFVAAWPSADVARLLGAVERDDSDGVRMVPPENWHVTLRFLGDVEIGAVIERLRSVALPAATADLGPQLEHLGPRQVVAPVAGVDRLAAAVTGATADLGEPPRRPFRGHLTVARLRRGATSRLPGARIEGSFAVDEVVVVESTLSSTGSRYEAAATLPTVGPV